MKPTLKGLEEHYEILGRIKGGGMGAVFKVRHRLHDEVRVVKVMRPHLVGSDEYRERFLREARAAIQLRHPNIAFLYDFLIDDDGTAYMVMEYIEGVDLAKLLRSSGVPKKGMVLEIARQSLKAIGFLHRKGFVHRDIAPDNLMLTRDEDGAPLIKLIDLGIVRCVELGDRITTSSSYLGKLHYSAPEQFGAGDPSELEARSDLYSFGVVLYEIATGICPFRGEGTAAIISGHLFHGPVPFRRSDPEHRVPAGLKAIILKALERDPERRFETAEQFVVAIDELRAWLPVEEGELDRLLAGLAASAEPAAEEAGPGQRFGAPVHAAPAEQEPGSGVRAHVEILLMGARKLLDLGHAVEARSQLEVLLRLMPDHEEARQLIKEIERSGGEEETEALAALVGSIEAHVKRGEIDTAASLLASVEGMLGRSMVLRQLRARIDSALAERERTDEMVNELMESSMRLTPASVKPAGIAATQSAASHGDRDASSDREREIAAATTAVEGFLRDGNLKEADRALKVADRLCGDREVFRSLRARIKKGLDEQRASSGKVRRLINNARKSSESGDLETALSFLELASSIAPENEEAARLRNDAERAYLQLSQYRRAEAEYVEATLAGTMPSELE